MGAVTHNEQRPRVPVWLSRACCCAVCHAPLMTTEGDWVTCFRVGHVGLIGRAEFEARVIAAWKEARTRQRVRHGADGAVRDAWEFVRWVEERSREPRTAPAESPNLFDGLTEHAAGG